MNDVNGAHCCCSMAAMLRHTYTAYFINWMSDCYTLLKQDCFAWSYTTLVCPSVCRSIGRFAGLSVGLPVYRSVCRIGRFAVYQSVCRPIGRSAGRSVHAQQIADKHFTRQDLNLLQNIETLKYLKGSFLLYFSLPPVHSRRCHN